MFASTGVCVKKLLDAGADVAMQTKKGKTALHVACQRGQTEIVNQLLDRWASPETQDSSGQTPIDLAARHGYDDISRILKKAAKKKRPATNRHYGAHIAPNAKQRAMKPKPKKQRTWRLFGAVKQGEREEAHALFARAAREGCGNNNVSIDRGELKKVFQQMGFEETEVGAIAHDGIVDFTQFLKLYAGKFATVNKSVPDGGMVCACVCACV